MTIKLVRQNKTLIIRTVRTSNVLGGASDRVGWIRISSVTVPGGATSNEVYEDSPGDTILQSITVSSGVFDVTVESSFPLVEVNSLSVILPRVGDIYRGDVSVTLVADGLVTAVSTSPEGVSGAQDSILVTLDTPPALLSLSFFGGYPGTQTELKAGDTIQIAGTTDKSCDAIEVQNIGASDSVQLISFATGTSFTVSVTIGDRGDVLQALAASARARSATNGALGDVRATNEAGGVVDAIDTVQLNNLFPSLSLGAISYPASQGALKLAESAAIVNSASDFDTIVYDSPAGELAISSPTLFESPKNLSRAGGSYNVSVNNLRAVATRNANNAVSTALTVVAIASVSAIVSVLEPATRLRSGGNDGTAPQDHAISIVSDQQLLFAPTLLPDLGGSRGSLLGSFTGGPLSWSALLRVLDADEKGVFSWGAMSATNLAGTVTTSIDGDSDYQLGGFVPRTLTFSAFATLSSMNVEVVDFSKVQAGTFTSTAQAAIRRPIATPPSVANGFTVDAVGINPTDVIWLDTDAAASNSGGTAQITNVEEVV